MTHFLKILLHEANLWIRLFLCYSFFIQAEVISAQTNPTEEVLKAYQHYFNFELDGGNTQNNNIQLYLKLLSR